MIGGRRLQRFEFLRRLVRLFYPIESILALDYLLVQKDFFTEEGVPDQTLKQDLKLDKKILDPALSLLRKAGIIASKEKAKKQFYWFMNGRLRENILDNIKVFKERLDQVAVEKVNQKYECNQCHHKFDQTVFELHNETCKICKGKLILTTLHADFDETDIAKTKQLLERIHDEVYQFRAESSDAEDEDNVIQKVDRQSIKVSDNLKIRLSHNFFLSFEKHLKEVEASKAEFKSALKKREWEGLRQPLELSKASSKELKPEALIKEKEDAADEEVHPNYSQMQKMLQKRKELAPLSDDHYREYKRKNQEEIYHLTFKRR